MPKVKFHIISICSEDKEKLDQDYKTRIAELEEDLEGYKNRTEANDNLIKEAEQKYQAAQDEANALKEENRELQKHESGNFFSKLWKAILGPLIEFLKSKL